VAWWFLDNRLRVIASALSNDKLPVSSALSNKVIIVHGDEGDQKA
jgi:hypothetical protein